MQDLSIDIKHMPIAFGEYKYLLVITYNQTNFTIVTLLHSRDAQLVAEALIYRVIYLFGPPRQIRASIHGCMSTETTNPTLYHLPPTHPYPIPPTHPPPPYEHYTTHLPPAYTTQPPLPYNTNRIPPPLL